MASLDDGVRPPRRRRGRWLLVVVIAALAVMAGFGGFGRQSVSPRYETASVTRGDVEEIVTALGKLQPRAYVDVGAQASGRLDRIPVAIGQKVKAGDLLAELDPQFQIAKVEAIKAEIARLEANLSEHEAAIVYRQAQLTRQTQLLTNSATSQSAHDESRHESLAAKARADATRAQIRQTRATLRAEEVLLSYTRIFAPIDGTVVAVDAREGQTLNSAYSTPIVMRIADLDVMTVWTQVSEADVTRLKVGMPVRFTTLGHRGKSWSAVLRQILPAPQRTLSAQTDGAPPPQQASGAVVLYMALFDVANPDGELRPDMSAQVSFVAAAASGVVLAPVAALKGLDPRTPDRAQAQVMRSDGWIETREVRLGLRTRFMAEVVSGLAEGEKAVTGVKPDQGNPLIRLQP